MIINVDKQQLLKYINIADSIIPSKSINTILGNCLLNVTRDEIEIISTDNEIAIRSKFDAVSDSEGSFTINGKKLSNILKELPDDEIVMNINDSFLIDLKTKSKEIKGHYTLIGTDADEYPEIPLFDDSNSIELEQPLLKEIIKKVVYAASIDVIKPIFNGVFFTSNNDNSITTVATDSRRLSIITRSVDNSINFNDGLIIPLKTVNEILRILEPSGTCRFSVIENQCFFKVGSIEIISRVVDGQFPNYKQVIPREHNSEVIVEKKKFLDSIKRAMIFTREPANKIVLTFEKDKLKIEVNTPELGKSEEEIAIESDLSEKISVGVNCQFLIDSLKEIDSFSVKCGITGQMSPLTIIPENDRNYTSVIMPIQIKSNQSD